MICRRTFLVGGIAALGTATTASAVPFDAGWTEQTFPRRRPNRWQLSGSAVGLESDAAVSLLVRPVPEPTWDLRGAAWRWSVSDSVPPTDLTRKGGDDRNLAVYFVFLARTEAERLRTASIRRVLTNRAARSLVYVWGGTAARGAILPNPWLDGRGVTVVLRPAGTGAYGEPV
ncbi:MAG: DUF3047 domain-containing protein [Gemmobacter sp.]